MIEEDAELFARNVTGLMQEVGHIYDSNALVEESELLRIWGLCVELLARQQTVTVVERTPGKSRCRKSTRSMKTIILDMSDAMALCDLDMQKLLHRCISREAHGKRAICARNLRDGLVTVLKESTPRAPAAPPSLSALLNLRSLESDDGAPSTPSSKGVLRAQEDGAGEAKARPPPLSGGATVEKLWSSSPGGRGADTPHDSALTGRLSMTSIASSRTRKSPCKEAPATPADAPIAIGSRIAKLFEEVGLCEGTVAGTRDEFYVIAYDDGDEEELTLDEVRDARALHRAQAFFRKDQAAREDGGAIEAALTAAPRGSRDSFTSQHSNASCKSDMRRPSHTAAAASSSSPPPAAAPSSAAPRASETPSRPEAPAAPSAPKSAKRSYLSRVFDAVSREEDAAPATSASAAAPRRGSVRGLLFPGERDGGAAAAAEERRGTAVRGLGGGRGAALELLDRESDSAAEESESDGEDEGFDDPFDFGDAAEDGESEESDGCRSFRDAVRSIDDASRARGLSAPATRNRLSMGRLDSLHSMQSAATDAATESSIAMMFNAEIEGLRKRLLASEAEKTEHAIRCKILEGKLANATAGVASAEAKIAVLEAELALAEERKPAPPSPRRAPEAARAAPPAARRSASATPRRRDRAAAPLRPLQEGAAPQDLSSRIFAALTDMKQLKSVLLSVDSGERGEEGAAAAAAERSAALESRSRLQKRLSSAEEEVRMMKELLKHQEEESWREIQGLRETSSEVLKNAQAEQLRSQEDLQQATARIAALESLMGQVVKVGAAGEEESELLQEYVDRFKAAPASSQRPKVSSTRRRSLSSLESAGSALEEPESSRKGAEKGSGPRKRASRGLSPVLAGDLVRNVLADNAPRRVQRRRSMGAGRPPSGRR